MNKDLDELCKESGIKREVFLSYVEKHWIHPTPWLEEDARRARLIYELLEDFGVNDEAVPLILHLIDQLHALRREYQIDSQGVFLNHSGKLHGEP